jgi:hypothetical protein
LKLGAQAHVAVVVLYLHILDLLHSLSRGS